MSDHAEIRIRRLQRRIEKLINQREHYKQRCEHYAQVISIHQYLERDARSYREKVKEHARVKDLERRVTEQAALIVRLMKEDAA